MRPHGSRGGTVRIEIQVQRVLLFVFTIGVSWVGILLLVAPRMWATGIRGEHYRVFLGPMSPAGQTPMFHALQASEKQVAELGDPAVELLFCRDSYSVLDVGLPFSSERFPVVSFDSMGVQPRLIAIASSSYLPDLHAMLTIVARQADSRMPRWVTEVPSSGTTRVRVGWKGSLIMVAGIAAAAIAVVASGRLVRARTRVLLRREGRCPECGYPVEIAFATCPECGKR